MDRIALYLVGLAILIPFQASAQTITQNNVINVEAVVRIGGPAVTINQTGVANYAGVIQVRGTPSVTVNQDGRVVNSVAIAQAGRNVSAAVNQVGTRALNSATISQRILSLRHSR